MMTLVAVACGASVSPEALCERMVERDARQTACANGEVGPPPDIEVCVDKLGAGCSNDERAVLLDYVDCLVESDCEASCPDDGYAALPTTCLDAYSSAGLSF